MFKKLFCKHKYKYYNTRVGYSDFNSFVCTECGKEAEVSQLDIDNAYSKYSSIYNKNIALGKEPIKSSTLSIRRHMDVGICYESPAMTLVLEEYSKRGIDLMELNIR